MLRSKSDVIYPLWDRLSTTEVYFSTILSVSMQSQIILSWLSVWSLFAAIFTPTSPLPPMLVSLSQMLFPHHLLVSPPPPCSKLYLLWCRMLSSERQYVSVLKGVEETYLPLLELSDTPASIRGKADTLFPNWASLSTFHSQNLLPAMEGALVQSLLQQDCFSKYVSGGIFICVDLATIFSSWHDWVV